MVDGVTVIHGDCLEVMRGMADGSVDAVVTDPPYPNNDVHFHDGIPSARRFMESFPCDHWLVFWNKFEVPPVPLPLVAKHVWHRSNTNMQENWEAVYEFHADGRKRACRCYSFPVISLGLTGCREATGHPTQKNLRLICKLMQDAKVGPFVLDPFLGSGTTLEACLKTGRKGIGIEIDPRYLPIIHRRLESAATPLFSALSPEP